MKENTTFLKDKISFDYNSSNENTTATVPIPSVKTDNNYEQGVVDIQNTSFFYMYALCIFTTLISNIDTGVIASSIHVIKEDFYCSDTYLGLTNSLEFLGQIIGSIVLISYQKYNKKCFFMLALIFKGTSLISPLFTINYLTLCIGRFICGFTQAFIIMYIPVWIDQYYQKDMNQKTLLISLIQFFVPIGMVFGFGLSTLFFLKWKTISAIESIALFIICGMIMVTSDSYFYHINTNNEASTLSSSNPLASTQSLYENRFANKVSLRRILNEPLFILLTLSLIFTFLTFQSLKFWSMDIFLNTLEETDKNFRLFCFAIIFFTGPIFGVLLGGITTSLLGGYEDIKTIFASFIFRAFAYGITWLIPVSNSTLLILLSLWVLFLFNTASVIIEMGIISIIHPPSYKGDAFALMSLMIWCFGYFPSSFIYGLLNETLNPNHTKVILSFSMQINALPIIIVFIGAFLRYFKQEKVYPISKKRLSEMITQGFGKAYGQYANYYNEE